MKALMVATSFAGVALLSLSSCLFVNAAKGDLQCVDDDDCISQGLDGVCNAFQRCEAECDEHYFCTSDDLLCVGGRCVKKICSGHGQLDEAQNCQCDPYYCGAKCEHDLCTGSDSAKVISDAQNKLMWTRCPVKFSANVYAFSESGCSVSSGDVNAFRYCQNATNG